MRLHGEEWGLQTVHTGAFTTALENNHKSYVLFLVHHKKLLMQNCSSNHNYGRGRVSLEVFVIEAAAPRQACFTQLRHLGGSLNGVNINQFSTISTTYFNF